MGTVDQVDSCKTRQKALRVAIFYNDRAADRVGTLVSRATQHLLEHGARVIVDPATTLDGKPQIETATPEQRIRHCDVALVFGGDGTMIGVGRLAADAGVPVLGINLGTFGFLTEASADHLDEAMALLIQGHYQESRRLALVCKCPGSAGSQAVFTAINDVFVTNRVQGRLIGLEVVVGNNSPIAFRADGVVVATPTGSTGHSLSAGGPILFPCVQGLVLTPVCAHSLASRPMVIPADDSVRIRPIRPDDSIRVIIDGQISHDPGGDQTIEVVCHPRGLSILQDPQRKFSDTMRTKFYLGQTS